MNSQTKPRGLYKLRNRSHFSRAEMHLPRRVSPYGCYKLSARSKQETHMERGPVICFLLLAIFHDHGKRSFSIRGIHSFSACNLINSPICFQFSVSVPLHLGRCLAAIWPSSSEGFQWVINIPKPNAPLKVVINQPSHRIGTGIHQISFSHPVSSLPVKNKSINSVNCALWVGTPDDHQL